MIGWHWLYPSWWKYLFSNFSDLPGATFEREVFNRFYIYRQFPWPKLFGEESVFERVTCRAKGHPKGVFFYDANGYEPDMHCKTCGEDLG